MEMVDEGASSPCHCHPYQFLLKSFRFPGVKIAM